MKFAYADPPYFGCGQSHYRHPEWDEVAAHYDLLARLACQYPDGWALSCNPRDLSRLLPRAYEWTTDVRVASWCKTWHQIRPTTVQFAWEPVIFCGGRKDPKRPMVRDWISGPATRQARLKGAKPSYFNDWILALLNYEPSDEFDDLFPATGGMDRAVERASHQLRPIIQAESGEGEER